MLEDQREDAVGRPHREQLSTIVLSGITIERNAASISTNATPSTNAITNGRWARIVALKSAETAVVPVT